MTKLFPCFFSTFNAFVQLISPLIPLPTSPIRQCSNVVAIDPIFIIFIELLLQVCRSLSELTSHGGTLARFKHS